MDSRIRVYLTAAAFCLGAVLASYSVRLIANENASFFIFSAVLVLVPLFSWKVCTSMIHKELSKQSIEESKGGVR